MTKRAKQAIIIIGIILVVFSVAVFVIPFRKGGTFWVAYTSELLVIALQIPVFKLAYDNAKDLNIKILGFPIFRVGYIYLAVQTMASIILFVLGGIFERFPIWVSLTICMIILAAAVICSIAADIAREEIEKIEEVQKIDTEFIKLMRVKSQNLMNENSNKKIAKLLGDLAEKFKYSDPVSSKNTASSETKIDIMFSELEAAVNSNEADKAEIICGKLITLIDNRNNICKLKK